MRTVDIFERCRGAGLREFARLSATGMIVIVFGLMMALQALGFLVLGTGRAGMGFSESTLVLDNLLALGCAWLAFRRARGIPALFWFLFCLVVFVLLVPTAIQAHDTIFATITLSESTRSLLYCLYGAPVLMMLFLPEGHRNEVAKAEVALDLFQVAIVIALIYATFFFLPVRRMLPSEANVRNVSVSNMQSLLLLVAGFVRLQFARVPATRNLLFRLVLFLLTCAIATFVGDWIYIHLPGSFASWFDLGWAVPIGAAALIAVRWVPPPAREFEQQSVSFVHFLGSNLVLVAMLCYLALLTERWKETYGERLTNAAIAASLVALTLRLAITQFDQYREIAQRRAAQDQLALSNNRIVGLLEYARRQTSEITEINELSAVLQACASREEAFRAISDRLERLFPGVSGSLSVLNPERTRAETVAEWGDRTNSTLASVGTKGKRSGHDPGASSISIPLTARDEAMGVLALHDRGASVLDPVLTDVYGRAHFRQLASTIAEHIALTVSNLDLRAALQTQAIRDPLTGLHNRRSMQEGLERELHRARRRERPLSVMMLDIDHFKRYNDTFGHAAGDLALRLVAETLTGSVRAEDLACRYGGEEFVVILPECALAQSAIRAEDVRSRLRNLYVERPGELPEMVTVSVGVAAFPETTGEIDQLLKFADVALYRAKREGRDRVAVAQPDLTDPRCPPQASARKESVAMAPASRVTH